MSAPKSLLDVANAGRASVPTTQSVEAPETSVQLGAAAVKPAPRSLLEVASATASTSSEVHKEKIETSKPTLLAVAHGEASKPTLLSAAAAEVSKKPTLLTVAKEAQSTLASVAAVSLQEVIAVTKAPELVEVATALRSDSRSSFQKKPTQTLVEIAATVDKARDAEVVHALHDASAAVEREQTGRQAHVAEVLVQAAREVAEDNAKLTRKDVAASLTRAAGAVQQAQATPAVLSTNKKPVATNQDNDADSDHYSDDEDEEETKAKVPAKVVDDNQSEEAEEVEKTSPTVSSESKTFIQAVYRGNVRRVKELLKDDTDANITDQHGWNGLHWAASQGHVNVLELLLDSGANVQAVEPIHLWSPLHLAAIRGHVACLKLLLRRGAEPKRIDIYGDSPLACTAVLNGTKKKQVDALFSKYQR
ncbi:hypothetical protein ACHHYP_00823 [Achlya hypogyna]|uniref:Uncharacterized protein n=1 Tax=Achlya hypogyna TaxID=1202772 RepID=A0A1V9ZAH6_ACHHY|nr:hypothetical protein ACHHYP_00823 [Achlya hypogyna]